MIKPIIVTVLVLFFNSFKGICQNFNYVKSSYCIVDDTVNKMDFGLDKKKDTIFLSYMNIIDDGKYINGWIDNSDYAGFFTTENIKDFKVTLKIKNYRFVDDSEVLTLTFLNKGEKCLWHINGNSPVGYLPKEAVFRNCSKNR